MGCASSKLDDSQAVALCRERCFLLDEAIHQRYALAEAHIAYIHSLKGIGRSLHNFFEQDLANSSGSPPSPTLNLPPQRKGDPVSTSMQPTESPIHHSHSNSGSHLHFHSDSDDDGSGSGSLHRSGHSSPLHAPIGHIDYMGSNQEALGSFPGGGFMHLNYMKNKATPSVVYEQRPLSPETLHQMGKSSSVSYFPNGYSNTNPNPYPYYDYSYSGGGYYGGSSPPPYAMSLPPPLASSSKPPPPPPSPPRASAWDFLNPFETYDKFQSAYTPSRDSEEVREEEGIPELEDEDYQHEDVKEDQGNHKFSGDGGKAHSNVETGGHEVDDSEASLYQTKPKVSMENEDGVEYEVHVVDKKVVDEEGSSEECGSGSKVQVGSRNVFEVAREIEVQFERASESGNDVSGILEVGKHPHSRKHVTSKMLHVVTPSLSVVSSQPSTSKGADTSGDNGGPAMLDFDEELRMRSRTLSSTLHKLYIWEKKLSNEVKAEEKMRILHERKCRKLKSLDDRGAEVHKIDSTRKLIRSLSTKIRIAIQVVDKISVTINKIRDEELWPQLSDFIQGLTRMWKYMFECHHSQCQAIKEGRGLGSIGSGKKLGDAHLQATLQLERELVNWTFSFSTWISAQKGYVRALNEYLFKCVYYEPEETPDGPIPYSPGRMGAPPVFVICHQWSEAMKRTSEKEVVDSMRFFTASVLQIWEEYKNEMRQRMMVNKDLERNFRNLNREDQKIQKRIQALDKKVILVSREDNNLLLRKHVVYQSDTSNASLQVCLQRIFEAMKRFSADTTKAYEELLQRSEEESLAREPERAP